MIKEGKVFVDKIKISKPGQLLPESAVFHFEELDITRFVSRAGLKLDGALYHLKQEVKGWQILDIGLSTGGFSDCLLQRGAHRIFGIEVGHGQTHKKIKADPRMVIFEGLNARDLR